MAALAAFRTAMEASPPATKEAQHAARRAFDPLAERLKGLVKQVDLLYKLAAAAGDAATDKRAASKRLKQLDADRHEAVAKLKEAAYVHRQVVWLQDRFPEAALRAVPGLVKVVTRAEIAAADWSLSPGRHVEPAPAEVDEDFDFEQALRDLHVELKDLNREAVELVVSIDKNLEALSL